MKSFCTKNGPICDTNFGFLKGRSTELALLNITGKTKSNIENIPITVGIYIHLSIAFDSVNPDIIIDKVY